MSDTNSDMSSQTNITVIEERRHQKMYSVSPEMMMEIKASIIYSLRSDPKFIKEIFDVAFTNDLEIEENRKISKEEAKIEVHDFIQKHVGCKTSEIIESLNIDPILVMEILKELKNDNFIQSKSIEC